MIECERVSKAIAEYDPDAHEAGIIKAEEQRRQFLELFPRSGWDTMTLDRYALGQADHRDNLCRWMEFVTSELGSMRGGAARKSLIYYRAGAGEWWFDRNLFTTVEEAWRAVHRGFVDAIGYAEAGEWGEIPKIAALRSGPALVNKTLSIYFPDELLPINSQTHLRNFLRDLRDTRADDPDLGATALNRMLLADLRQCDDLDGWTTKEMERLLYTSRFGPEHDPRPDGPITDVAGFIDQTLEEAGTDRIQARREADDEARALLDRTAGQMTAADVRELLRLFNVDSNNGKRAANRFSPAFMAPAANALTENLADLNTWTERIWRGPADQALAATNHLLANRRELPNAGSSYPTMLMYLRDSEKRAVWGRMTDDGLKRLTTYKPKKGPGQGLAEDYATFCSAAEQLMTDYDVPPELVDYLLAAAGRAVTKIDQPPLPPSSGIWLFQANPSIYDIDSALSEMPEIDWVVRQYTDHVKKGDRVYLWRSGADAGLVATATVISDVESLSGGGDPYVVKPESLSKPEPRVRLRIDSVLPSVIRRSDLIGQPVLGDLQVIRQPNATNFKVTAAESEALQALLTGFRIPIVSGALADQVHLPLAWIQDAVELLSEKGQVVFYGPPGTGKTYVAMALAKEITKNGGDSRVVQFHPSYSYEDFVGGFRPVEDDSAFGVKYQRTNGPLREIAALAAADPSHPYVLIIDEINRGNIPKILGELLFLLEYRQSEVRLQFWPEVPFSLPKNLLLIGTMNTADRSIALVDAALRRRFYFVEFTPTEQPVKGVLERWLKHYGHSDEPARLLDALNEQIAKDELSIGPSYFMTDAEGGPDLDRIWSRAIMPLLEEYYFGMTWDKQQFALATLRARLARATAESAALPSPDGEVA